MKTGILIEKLLSCKTREEINSLATKILSNNCTNCKDCNNCYDCTNCIGCINCDNCYNCVNCKDCKNCNYCKDCRDCNNCIRCEDLIKVEYAIANIQVTEEEYQEIVEVYNK
jgi:hypothetical protein